eukprot:5505736-Pyramimonas_sp.AAC.1
MLRPDHVAAGVAPEVQDGLQELRLRSRFPQAPCQRHVRRVAEVHAQVADVASDRWVDCQPPRSPLRLLGGERGLEVRRRLGPDACR